MPSNEDTLRKDFDKHFKKKKAFRDQLCFKSQDEKKMASQPKNRTLVIESGINQLVRLFDKSTKRCLKNELHSASS